MVKASNSAPCLDKIGCKTSRIVLLVFERTAKAAPFGRFNRNMTHLSMRISRVVKDEIVFDKSNDWKA